MGDCQRAFGLCRSDGTALDLGVQTMEDGTVVKLCPCECKQHKLVQHCNLFGNRVLDLRCNFARGVPCAVHMTKMGERDLLEATLTWAEDRRQAELKGDQGMAKAEERRFKLIALRCACAELADMHSAGLIHGDVKPENIVVQADSRGDVVSGALIDFGSVWQIGRTWQPQRCTRAYAPRHLYGTPATPLVDLYGLAMTAAAVMLVESVPDCNVQQWISRCELAFRLLHAPSAAAQLHIFDDD